MLQKRAPHKYHSGNLWTNTCCSHPYEGKTLIECANERLIEEMGIDTKLSEIFSFVYKKILIMDLQNMNMTMLYLVDTLKSYSKS